jgi:RNA polymerase sigma factor (sigma-70 family)
MILTLSFIALSCCLSAYAYFSIAGSAGSESDEELFFSYLGGDDSAFEALFARYSPPLTRLMKRRIRAEQEAKELVQQTFLQLHRARLDFRPGAPLRPWLYTIALNLRREATRKGARNAVDLVAQPGDLEQKAIAEPHDPAASERRAQLRRALGELPEGQRTVIALHWFDGLSFGEVAEVLGANLSAVKVRAHRGYKALRASMGTNGVLTAPSADVRAGAVP